MHPFFNILVVLTIMLSFSSCKGLVKIEKVNIQDEIKGLTLSSDDLSSHKPMLHDSMMFEINAEKLKRHIEQNKVVWLHFVYSRLCADAEIYDCDTYKELNEKYRVHLSYVMVSEIAHSKLAQELKNGCRLVGYHTYIDDKTGMHNEVKALKNLKKEVFGIKNNDSLIIQTNYLIIDKKIIYASDQTLDKKRIEAILDNL